MFLGWFSTADSHWCRQRPRHQLVLGLGNCGRFLAIEGGLLVLDTLWLTHGLIRDVINHCARFSWLLDSGIAAVFSKGSGWTLYEDRAI